MSKPKNILFIMADQLRADYLSCYGHPTLQTPAMDWLASRGMRFDRAYVQATVCGPSRMSFYTGRYMSSHGSTYNGVPLRVGEMTIGDHLRPLGVRTALVGKTHMAADMEGMKRLGVDPNSYEGVLASQCGFEPFERDDGLWPDEMVPEDLPYNRYLRSLGYNVDNPWHDYANAGRDEDGNVKSAWYLRNSGLAAEVREEHSETAYMTDRAMDFIRGEAGRIHGACTCPTSSRTGPISRRRPITTCIRPTTSCPPCAARPSARTRIRSMPPTCSTRRA
jgi:arylsulfatase A-like enzyme